MSSNAATQRVGAQRHALANRQRPIVADELDDAVAIEIRIELVGAGT